ncbi:UBE2F [Bugula neritina]|uniref:E2 NEDD8-conjugating enzyme n=1 Tax=Bugula neritina TaxID=10212 RepID=A0A7J7J2K8_BUGNE|nr:UBE2F [Bugula neritina]
MYNLQKRIKEQTNKKTSSEPTCENSTGRVSVRDRLLIQEVNEVPDHLPKGCNIIFPNPDRLHEILLRINPNSGYWKGGTFEFEISVPLEYNIMPPSVKCKTKIWHPNIDINGVVCLSILRSRSLDPTGWAPTRTLKDVVWGICALFGDLLNFDDPLNVEAADLYLKDKVAFESKVKHYVNCYARYL